MKYSMKSIVCVNVCIASLFIAGSAYATTSNPQNKWYIGASGDLTWLRHSDTGAGGNVDLGYQFDNMRVEVEAGYHGASGENGYGNTRYFTYMGNLYYDFNKAFYSSNAVGRIVPYIGAGLGDAAIHYGSSSFSNTFHHHDNTLAYQGMAGLTFTCESMPNMDMSVGYRYLGTESHDLNASNLELGLKFHF